MIDAIEPLSLVLWGVFFLAAGMYPLGFMLGAPCSPCCDTVCEPLFHRCLRQKSVGGSVPTTPSGTIYFLNEAGIIKASSTASATMSVNIQRHGYLSDGESVVYTVPVRGYGESYGVGVECSGVSGSITVRVEGRDFPLRFRDVSLGNVRASTAFSASSVVGVIDDDFSDNLSASVSSAVIAATVSSSQNLDSNEVTGAVLRGMLTVSQPYFDAFSDVVRIPKIDVSLLGNGSIFRYIQSQCTITWLVRVQRGTATTHFRVSARVTPDTSPPSVPVGMTQAAIQPLPEVTDTPVPGDIAPVVNGTTVIAKGHRVRGYIVEVPVTLDLSGRCTVDARSFYFGAVTAAGTTAPTRLGQRLFATGSYLVSLPLDEYVFRIEHLVNEPAGEEYNFDKVGQYRRGEISLPVSYRRLRGNAFVTDRYDMQIVEPSPLCGLPACNLPQDLLPQGITYTPTAGTKWDCKDAYPLVLGNPRGGCYYSHQTNECRGSASAGVWLIEFFTPFTLPLAENGYPGGTDAIDALTWLEFTPGVITKANGTYEITGTYNAGAGRYGRCYTASVADRTFASDVGGTCSPAEYTVTISDIAPVGEVDFTVAVFAAQIASIAGDYILSPLGGGCWGSYYGGGRSDLTSLVNISLGNFHGNQIPGFAYTGGSFLTDVGFSQGDLACNALLRQSVFVRASVETAAGSGRRCAVGFGPSHSPAIQGEKEYGSTSGFAQALFQGGQFAQYACKIAVTDGSPMTQCNHVTFSPTEVTGEAGKPLFISVGNTSPNTTNVAVSGEYARCGHGVLFSYPGGFDLTEKFIGAGNSSSDLTKTVRRTLMSDGSPPQVLTITLPGKCQSVATTTGITESQPIIASADGECISINVIPNGQSCEWTATSDSEWAVIDEEAKSGAGVGIVKVKVSSADRFVVRRCRVTITLSSDSTKTVQSHIYQAG